MIRTSLVLPFVFLPQQNVGNRLTRYVPRLSPPQRVFLLPSPPHCGSLAPSFVTTRTANRHPVGQTRWTRWCNAIDRCAHSGSCGNRRAHKGQGWQRPEHNANRERRRRRRRLEAHYRKRQRKAGQTVHHPPHFNRSSPHGAVGGDGGDRQWWWFLRCGRASYNGGCPRRRMHTTVVNQCPHHHLRKAIAPGLSCHRARTVAQKKAPKKHSDSIVRPHYRQEGKTIVPMACCVALSAV